MPVLASMDDFYENLLEVLLERDAAARLSDPPWGRWSRSPSPESDLDDVLESLTTDRYDASNPSSLQRVFSLHNEQPDPRRLSGLQGYTIIPLDLTHSPTSFDTATGNELRNLCGGGDHLSTRSEAVATYLEVPKVNNGRCCGTLLRDLGSRETAIDNFNNLERSDESRRKYTCRIVSGNNRCAFRRAPPSARLPGNIEAYCTDRGFNYNFMRKQRKTKQAPVKLTSGYSSMDNNNAHQKALTAVIGREECRNEESECVANTPVFIEKRNPPKPDVDWHLSRPVSNYIFDQRLLGNSLHNSFTCDKSDQFSLANTDCVTLYETERKRTNDFVHGMDYNLNVVDSYNKFGLQLKEYLHSNYLDVIKRRIAGYKHFSLIEAEDRKRSAPLFKCLSVNELSKQRQHQPDSIRWTKYLTGDSYNIEDLFERAVENLTDCEVGSNFSTLTRQSSEPNLSTLSSRVRGHGTDCASLDDNGLEAQLAGATQVCSDYWSRSSSNVADKSDTVDLDLLTNSQDIVFHENLTDTKRDDVSACADAGSMGASHVGEALELGERYSAVLGWECSAEAEYAGETESSSCSSSDVELYCLDRPRSRCDLSISEILPDNDDSASDDDSSILDFCRRTSNHRNHNGITACNDVEESGRLNSNEDVVESNLLKKSRKLYEYEEFEEDDDVGGSADALTFPHVPVRANRTLSSVRHKQTDQSDSFLLSLSQYQLAAPRSNKRNNSSAGNLTRED